MEKTDENTKSLVVTDPKPGRVYPQMGTNSWGPNRKKPLTMRHKRICLLYFQGMRRKDIVKEIPCSISLVNLVLSSKAGKAELERLHDATLSKIVHPRSKLESRADEVAERLVGIALNEIPAPPNTQVSAIDSVLDRVGISRTPNSDALRTLALIKDEKDLKALSSMLHGSMSRLAITSLKNTDGTTDMTAVERLLEDAERAQPVEAEFQVIEGTEEDAA